MKQAHGSSIGRRLAIGAVSGVAGTAAMDLLQYLRYRRGGGEQSPLRWESAEGVTSWDAAPAPGQLGEKLARRISGAPLADHWARTMTNTVHWATGAGWGLQYALVTGSPSQHAVVRALALGPAAWLSGYAVLPLAGVYEPIWRYDLRTLGTDLSAHVVYGAVTSAAYALLSGSAKR